MTDNEIIKALECCANADCRNCPRWSELWYRGRCADFLPSVLDLINRQRAEIEELTARNERQKYAIKVYHIGETRSEAIKEFAEVVKANRHKLFNYIYSSIGFGEQIDNLVKEMVGEQE